MATTESVQRVRIYLRENDSRAGEAIYLALLDALRRHGASGATVLRGVAGFGPTEQLRASVVSALSTNPPLVVEWIDRAERVGRVLPLLDELIGGALVTVEQIAIHRAVLRAGGPFAPDRSCGEIADRTPPTLHPQQLLANAAALVGTHGALAVTDDAGFVVGVLSPGDLRRRAGVRLPLSLWPALELAERAEALRVLSDSPGTSVAQALTAQPRCVAADAPIAQAAATLIEWDFARLPVLAADGRYLGLIGGVELLRAAQPPGETQAISVAGRATSVSLIMQTALPQVGPELPLLAVVERLAASPAGVLVVADAAGAVLGIVDAPSLMRGVEGTERAATLRLLSGEAAAAELADSSLQAGALLTPTPTIGPQATLFEAVDALLAHDRAFLPVADDGRLVGLVGRSALLRALAHEG
jgi:PII-like signaling protein/predicted transcriptional regulator